MNTLLFPHWVQKVAIWVCFITFILFFATIFLSLNLDFKVGRLFDSVMVTIIYLSIFCCIFSREKREDEFISSMRLRSVAIVAFIAFLMVVVLNIVQAFLPVEMYDSFKEWRKNTFWNGEPIMDLAILYFLIFKLSISRKS